MEDDRIFRQERRKLFMRLHILPWLLLVFVLCLFNWFVVYYTNHLYSAIKIDQIDQIDRIRDISMNNDIMAFHREAIDRGYGRWEIDNDTLTIRFAWIDIGDLGDLADIDLVNKRSNVDNVSNVFSIEDFELSLSLGMDLESDIKRGVLLLLDFHLGNSSIDSGLVKKIKLDISDFIGRRFLGFKTYNRIKDKQ